MSKFFTLILQICLLKTSDTSYVEGRFVFPFGPYSGSEEHVRDFVVPCLGCRNLVEVQNGQRRKRFPLTRGGRSL